MTVLLLITATAAALDEFICARVLHQVNDNLLAAAIIVWEGHHGAVALLFLLVIRFVRTCQAILRELVELDLRQIAVDA